MHIIGTRKVAYSISGFLFLLSIVSLALWGLKLGIDFIGGSLMEIEYKNARPAKEEILERIQSVNVKNTIIQPTGEKSILIRFSHIDESTHQSMISALGVPHEAQEKRFDTIGPTIGKELRRKSLIAIALVIFMIILYISLAFRKVSRPVASWKYGVAAVTALIHDVTIPTGVFSALGHFYGIEIDTLFVTALLTILGFSVHDTIVVFDRIRENLKKIGAGSNFEDVVERSIRETIVRSINTSLTVLLVMAALYFFGGASTKYFSLALLIGIFFGTYSSIFIASAILVTWHKFSLQRA